MKKVIKELIVVEGKNDTNTLKRFFECDTIETNGLDLKEEVLDYIAFANEKRGVIVFTDPDSPGNRIRDRINKRVPTCKNAFVNKKLARTTKKVGIEHAGKQALEDALSHLVTYIEKPKENVSVMDLYELGLLGGENSSKLREKVGTKLHLGAGNAKTMRQRINCLGIDKEELRKVVEEE